jgi:hypothetical protein
MKSFDSASWAMFEAAGGKFGRNEWVAAKLKARVKCYQSSTGRQKGWKILSWWTFLVLSENLRRRIVFDAQRIVMRFELRWFA